MPLLVSFSAGVSLPLLVRRVHPLTAAVTSAVIATARLLPRLLNGRTRGPAFLADWRAPASGPRACGRRHLPRHQARPPVLLTCRIPVQDRLRGAGPHGQGWTLHQLRHSALQHLAQAGRTAPELQAKSRHQHLASLGRYVRPGEETSARITAEHAPAARRRSR
uniref:hypothetical protein n=1 Tax=Nonomuraea sp. CA-252377 TaxID=3240003 RepID=UPI003F499F59